jgi:outer membrane protein assembly factor BamB
MMKPHGLILLLALAAGLAFGQPAVTPLFWPDKQGPTRNGVVPERDAAKLPLGWDEASGKGIAWKTPLEDEGHCTPVIGGDLIWFTSATTDGRKMFVYCVDRHSGKILQHKLLFENDAPEELGNPINNYAAPSCVLEPDALYVHFGTYGTARLDPRTAEVVWQRRDIKVRHFRGPGSSPVIFENLLILTFDGIDQQFTLALDKNTGKDVWKTPRTTDYHDLDKEGKPTRDGDLRKAYGTPALIKVGNQTQIVSVGSHAAFGYDARTGRELWTVPHSEYNAASRPLVLGDMVYINTGFPRGHLLALKVGPETTGDVTSKLLWDRAKYNAELASGVLVNNHIFEATGAAVGVCVKLDTGEEAWQERLFTGAGKIISSGIGTQDRIYFFNEAGESVVLAATPEFKVLARNHLASGMTASPAEAEGDLYLRTKTALYKITK